MKFGGLALKWVYFVFLQICFCCTISFEDMRRGLCNSNFFFFFFGVKASRCMNDYIKFV